MSRFLPGEQVRIKRSEFGSDNYHGRAIVQHVSNGHAYLVYDYTTRTEVWFEEQRLDVWSIDNENNS